MLKNKVIGNISKEIATDYNGVIQPESGLNLNDYNQLRKALNIAEFAKDDYKKNLNEELDESLKYLLIALSSINETKETSLHDLMKYLCLSIFSVKDSLKEASKAAKYSLDIAALKSEMAKIDLHNLLKEAKEYDAISLFETLSEMLDMNIAITKNARDNSIKYIDIKSTDLNNIYLHGTHGKISVAKIPYLNAKVKNDIKYGLSLLGKKTLSGTSKVLKRIDRQKSV